MVDNLIHCCVSRAVANIFLSLLVTCWDNKGMTLPNINNIRLLKMFVSYVPSFLVSVSQNIPTPCQLSQSLPKQAVMVNVIPLKTLLVYGNNLFYCYWQQQNKKRFEHSECDSDRQRMWVIKNTTLFLIHPEQVNLDKQAICLERTQLLHLPQERYQK